MSFLSKFIGDPNQKVLDQIQPIAEKVNSFEPEIEKLSDEQLKNKTEECQRRLLLFAKRRKELWDSGILMSRFSAELFCIREKFPK
jgi:preprotein translocase subunit SecA